MPSNQEMLANQIWWTKKARIEAEQRLKNNSFHLNFLLFHYSIFSVGISIYYFRFNPDSEYLNFIWILFSVVIFCIQCFASGYQFDSRAGLLKECYEALGDLYIQCKNADEHQLEIIREEYRLTLRSCENHLSIDYFRSIFNERWIMNGNIEKKINLGHVDYLNQIFCLENMYITFFVCFSLYLGFLLKVRPRPCLPK